VVPTDHRGAGPITYRTATVDDVDTVLTLWAAAGVHPSTTDDAAGLTTLVSRDIDALLVAEIDGRMVGTLIVGWDGWRGNMYRLAVVPEARRHGVAATLVRRGEDRLRQLGGRRITALVVDTDDHAVGFWTSVGYEPYAIARYVRTLDAPRGPA
jgi:ribosomal protein S18 acetylase RimI-like enzyme